jgi:hypothetical protein
MLLRTIDALWREMQDARIAYVGQPASDTFRHMANKLSDIADIATATLVPQPPRTVANRDVVVYVNRIALRDLLDLHRCDARIYREAEDCDDPLTLVLATHTVDNEDSK